MVITQPVAIIIASYNAANTIVRAIKSALAEPEVAEVVVVDDASSDMTAAIASTADDGTGRLKIITQPVNTGPSAARNMAIKFSTSPWIGILDSDDFFVAGRMAQLLAFSDRADLIADDAGQVPEGAIDDERKSLLCPEFDKARLIGFAAFVLSDITGANNQKRGFGFIKPIIRRSFISKHHLQYQETMRLGEDYEFYARALALGARLYVIPYQGYISVVRRDSLSNHHSVTDLRHFRDSDIHLATLPNLKKTERDALYQHFRSIDCRLQWRLLINAFKDRNLCKIMGTFLRPYPVPFYLLARLKDEAIQRIKQKLRQQK